MSPKGIRQSLGLGREVNASVKAVLRKMVYKGLILQKGSRFAHPGLQGPVIPKDPAQRAAKLQRFQPEAPKEDDNLVQGRFMATAKGFGFVNIGEGKSDIFIPEGEQNGAMDGDQVEVRVFNRRGRTRGFVQRIVERSTSRVLARLVRGKRTVLAIPLNQRSGVPPVVIKPSDDNVDIKSGEIVEIELLSQTGDDRELYARVLQVVTTEVRENLGFNLILTENQIPKDFPKAALEQAEGFSTRVVWDPQTGRVDQRHLGYVTIDGKTARDFDDAVYAHSNDDGTWQLYVAIADVAHYVQPGDAIDLEAYKRGTSVYFPTHAIPMLPEALSNNLCSLRPEVNRFALVCEMKIDDAGQVVSYRIYESVIRSKARLIYEDVAELLDTGTSKVIRNREVLQNLEVMQHVAQLLRTKRAQRGAINFSFPDFQIELDENNHMCGVKKTYQSSSMKLIEQFMLEANETIARHCSGNRLPALYRVHAKPDMGKLERLRRVFQRFDIRVPLASLTEPGPFNDVLAAIEALPNRDQLQIYLLRTMALASYRTKNQGHFGLGAEFYSHFTSPIRRYPDLVTHRALKHELQAKLGHEVIPLQHPSDSMAEYLSEQERRAEKAENESIDLMKVTYLAPHLGHTFDARIVSAENSGFRVELLPQQVEWFLPLEVLTDDHYFFDEASLVLQGRRTKRLLQAGDRLRVRLVRVDTLHRLLEFQVEELPASSHPA
jgi:ribonuclease R